MKRVQLVVLAVLMGMLFVPAAMARGMEGGCKLKALGLTPEQQQRVDKLQLNLLEKIAPAKAQIAIKRAELRLLWTAPEPDKKAILGKQLEMDSLRQKIREARVDFRLEVLKVLKPEQKTNFLMHTEHGMMGMGKGMGMGMGMGMESECGCGCEHMGGHGQGTGMGGQGHPGCSCMGD
jgi:Spy/CpxP family protein refolding chaperone